MKTISKDRLALYGFIICIGMGAIIAHLVEIGVIG